MATKLDVMSLNPGILFGCIGRCPKIILLSQIFPAFVINCAFMRWKDHPVIQVCFWLTYHNCKFIFWISVVFVIYSSRRTFFRAVFSTSIRALLNFPPVFCPFLQWIFFPALIDYFEEQCKFRYIERYNDQYVHWWFTEACRFFKTVHLRCSQKLSCIRFHSVVSRYNYRVTLFLGKILDSLIERTCA